MEEEEIKVKLEKVYHHRNQEKWGRFPEEIHEAIEYPIGESKWFSTGRWTYNLAVAKGGLYLIAEWEPQYGYSWEEAIIYKLIITAKYEEL